MLGLLLSLSLSSLALYWDIKSFKIPNKCIICGLLMGLLKIFLDGEAVISLSGMIVGFFMMLMLYLVRAVGAGDVKLVAVLGLLLGTESIISIVILSLLFGAFVGIAECRIFKSCVLKNKGHRFHYSIGIFLSVVVNGIMIIFV